MSLEELSAEEFVLTVDPSLRFCSNLRNMEFSGSRIYRVEREGIFYVLKAVNHSWPWRFGHLKGERAVLQEMIDVDGITHLVRDYGEIKDPDGEEPYEAILKEYAEGDAVNDFDLTMRQRKKYAAQLTKIVKAFHRYGFSGLDIKADNVIASPDRQRITLIDFYREDIASLTYQTQDLRAARGLFL